MEKTLTIILLDIITQLKLLGIAKGIWQNFNYRVMKKCDR